MKPSPGVESVAIVVQEPAPAGLYSKTTCAVSAEVVTPSVTVPDVAAPGSFSVITGASLSSVTVRVGGGRLVAGDVGDDDAELGRPVRVAGVASDCS